MRKQVKVGQGKCFLNYVGWNFHQKISVLLLFLSLNLKSYVYNHISCRRWKSNYLWQRSRPSRPAGRCFPTKPSIIPSEGHLSAGWHHETLLFCKKSCTSFLSARHLQASQRHFWKIDVSIDLIVHLWLFSYCFTAAIVLVSLLILNLSWRNLQTSHSLFFSGPWFLSFELLEAEESNNWRRTDKT